MIGALMIYGVAIGVALTGVGVILEHAAALIGLPRRAVWAGMLVATVLLIGALPWRADEPVSKAESSVAVLDQPGDSLLAVDVARPSWWVAARDRLRAGVNAAATAVARLDAFSRWMWILASAVMALVYAVGQWTLSRRRREWRAERVRGVPVLVAPQDGPAVIGVLDPKIVLPEWALGLEPAAIDLMIRHEQEHATSRDPLLVHVASVIVLAMPWNPAAWWMVSRLRLAVELDCDARVLRTAHSHGDPVSAAASVYAELLLAVAERRSPRRALVAPALIEHSSTLRRRISAMYPSHIRLRLLRATASSGAASVLFIVALAFPAPRLLAQSSPPDVALVAVESTPQAMVAVDPVPAASTPAPRPAAGHRARAISLGERTAASRPEGQSQTPQSDPVYPIGNGVTSPVLITKLDPSYTTAAMAAKIQGEVWLDGIVERDGTLSHLSVKKSLDPTLGLDQSALDAAGKWTFKPGTKDGQPVRVAVQLILEFRLKPTVYKAGDPGLVAPVVMSHPDPTYTSDAMRAKIQGTVKIEAVVGIDGTVSSVKIVESLDQAFGLDESALKAARQWTFEPGSLQGTAVPVRVVLSLEFRLH